MCIQGIRYDTSDIRESDVARQEVLNGDLISGRENGRATAAAPAGLERQAEAGVLLHVRRSEVQRSNQFQVQAWQRCAGQTLAVSERALNRSTHVRHSQLRLCRSVTELSQGMNDTLPVKQYAD